MKVFVQVKNSEYKKYLQCKHPKDKQSIYHDGAILCNVCKCIISQGGEVFDEPTPLTGDEREYLMKQITLPTEEEIQTAIENAEYELFETDEVLPNHIKYNHIAARVYELITKQL